MARRSSIAWQLLAQRLDTRRGHRQHEDTRSEPAWRRGHLLEVSDLVTSGGFHTFMAVPVRYGTMYLNYETVIPYSEELIARTQMLAV